MYNPNNKIRRYYSIYNADKRELMGIFKSNDLVVRFLFDRHEKYAKGKLLNKIVFKKMATKERLEETRFDFPIAIRESKDEHIQVLGNDDYFITDSYNDYTLNTRMKGFDYAEEKMNRIHCSKVGADPKNYGKPIGNDLIK